MLSSKPMMREMTNGKKLINFTLTLTIENLFPNH
jgi:hypothetical protein